MDNDLLGLPQAKQDQAFFDVSPFEAGMLSLPDYMCISSPSNPDARRLVPSLAFLLKHSVSGSLVLFDLGSRKLDDLSPAARSRVKSYFSPFSLDKDVAETLKDGGVEPRDINTVIISHVHWYVP